MLKALDKSTSTNTTKAPQVAFVGCEKTTHNTHNNATSGVCGNRQARGCRQAGEVPHRPLSSPSLRVGGEGGPGGSTKPGLLVGGSLADRDGWRPALAETEASPGWVFRPVGARLLVAVTPWPEYGEAGAAWWPAKVIRCFDGKDPTRRYWLGWSARLGRWTASNEATRLRRDLTADELLELNSHMLDVLEGALC